MSRTQRRRHGDGAPPWRVAPPAATRVAAVMTEHVVCVDEATSADSLRFIFVDQALGAAPVLDGAGRLVGIVSKTDVLRESVAPTCDLRLPEPSELAFGFHIDEEPAPRARDVMTPVVVTVTPETSLVEAATTMTRHGIHHLVVLDGRARVAGILSALDVVRWVAGLARPEAVRRRH